MNYRPWYNENVDYQTNAKSYMDYLGRVNKFMKVLMEDYEVFQELVIEELKQIKFNAEMAVEDIILNWLEDGTLERIINDEVFGNKADTDWVANQLNQLKEDINDMFNQQDQLIDESFNQQNQLIDETLNDYNNRINQLVSINDYDVDPTGINDSLQGFKNALDNLKDNETLVLDTNGKYFLSDTLEHIRNGKINIEGNGSIILSDINNPNFEESRALSFKGVFKEANFLIGGIEKGNSKIKVSNTNNIKKGDLLHFKSEEQLTGSREYYKKGGVFTVGMVLSDTELTINGSFPYNISGSISTIIDVYNPITVNIKDLTIIGNNDLPSGYVGLAIENSVNSKIENVSSDNFNHCFHFRKHMNTIANHLESGRSMYPNTKESYGLASYMGTNFYLSNSVFNSGRHALEISGFENSFNTIIDNITAQAEADTISFNLHQSSYNLVIKNSSFDSFGLAGHVVMDNCNIGDKKSNIKTSNRYQYSSYTFKNCYFSDGIIHVSDDAQTQPNNASYIGVITFDNCKVSTKLHLELFLSYHVITTDRLIIKDTDGITMRVSDGCVLNSLFMQNCTMAHDANFIVSLGGRINEINISNSRLLERYNLFNMDDFDRINLDKIFIIPNPQDSGKGAFRVSSLTDTKIPKGVINITNTDLRLLPFSTGGFDELNLINSKVEFSYGRDNIVKIREATMTDIK